MKTEPLKVSELIEYLKNYPLDAIVVVDTSEEEIDIIEVYYDRGLVHLSVE